VSRDEANAILALKNAWTGAVATAGRLQELAPAVAGLAGDARMKDLDFETYHRVALAHANAAQALRGLLEELKADAVPADS
jgi:hypothetical protein